MFNMSLKLYQPRHMTVKADGSSISKKKITIADIEEKSVETWRGCVVCFFHFKIIKLILFYKHIQSFQRD